MALSGTPTACGRCPPGDYDKRLPNLRSLPATVDRKRRSRRHAQRAPAQESWRRCPTRVVGCSGSFRHVRPTRCRLRPSRSMKVFSSNSTEQRSIGTRPSLVTNFATHRVRDSSARSDWTRRAWSSSSNTLPSGPDLDLRSKPSGGAGTEGCQEVVVPPPHCATTPVLTAGSVAPERDRFRRQRPRV